MFKPVATLSNLLYESNHLTVASEIKNIVVVFDGNHSNADCCDIIHKYKNEEDKWAFKWIKKNNDTRQEFVSGFDYDDIISIKNNRLVFIKNGETGFWYFNSRTEFTYP